MLDDVDLELDNIQGLLVRGYTHSCSCHILVNAPTADALRKLLAYLRLHVVGAGDWGDEKPASVLNVSLTFAGLQALQLSTAVYDAFPSDFKELPDQGRTGDFNDSAPEFWWQGRFKTSDIHAAVPIYGVDEAALTDRCDKLRQELSRLNIRELRPMGNGDALQGRALPEHRVHFGYRDGISQPNVRWGKHGAFGKGPEVDFRNFLIGYPSSELHPWPIGGIGDVFRDSSYLVLRWIGQDVATFNRYLDDNCAALAPELPRDEARELLAAKLIGRWRDGSPLVLSPTHSDPSLEDANDFNYSADPRGESCPFSAHIRVMNPRGQELSPHVKKEGIPQIIRRGMPFGPEMEGSTDDGRSRGIIGMFLCSSIRSQFYTLASWMKRNDFSPVFDANPHFQDPLANHKLTGVDTRFVIPRAGQTDCIVTLQDFTVTLGTAFLILPGIKTLEFLSQSP